MLPATKFSKVDGREICIKCGALTGTLNGLKAACSEDGYPYWASKIDLQISSENCPLCRIIWEARSWRSTRLSGPLRIHASLEILDRKDATSLINNQHPLWNAALSGFQVRDSGNPTRSRLVELYACTEQNNSASAVITRRPILADVGGTIALLQVRTWLSACQSLHSQCAGNRDNPMPTRLLNVGSDAASPHVHVQETKGKIGIYAALSYCWGVSEQPTTLKSNLASRERQIILKELPQTVQDAVYVVRSLNIQFLWIDALCIIQDDEVDKRIEIQEMGSIYKNAIFTIAASSSGSVMDGFLLKRDELASVHLPIQLSGDTFGTVRLNRWQYADVYDEPLHQRGWTLQEHLLSRRILLFSKHELLWRCATHQLIPIRRSHLQYSTFFQGLPVHIFGIPAHPLQSLQKQQLEIWPKIVLQYSSRKLSNPADKINALVGIAKELSAYWKDVYLIGLWRKTFIRNLAWSRAPKEKVLSERLFSVTPTWSWLSVNYRTQMWPLLCIEDASLAQQSVLPIVTYGDSLGHAPNILVNARVLDASTFIEKAGAKLYFVEMDLSDSNILANDTFVALLGYQKKKRWYCVV